MDNPPSSSFSSSLPPSPPPSTKQRSTTVLDLDEDALVHCARNLSLRDISNMAMTCKSFRAAAYSDCIWRRLFRECWPLHDASVSSLQVAGAREAYLARCMALRQFKFVDPCTRFLSSHITPYNHILLDRSNVYFAQGTTLRSVKIGGSFSENVDFQTLGSHNARITCMRLFPLTNTSWFQSEAQNNDKLLVTSSCDLTIRLWWKGHSQRRFRGHQGAVTTLADQLLGDYSGNVLASGGEDCTVRLWSLSSSGKCGQHALKATFYGHVKPITSLSIAGHNPYLLVSIAKDAKVRVWDTTASSGVRSSHCVGTACVHGAPVGIKCHEALCFIAAGSSVTAIDLRTMREVSTLAVHDSRLYSFQSLPSKSLICTGGDDKAMLWDIRKNQGKPQQVANLDGHSGPIAHIHMDPYKVVTGGPADSYVKIWETDTGSPTNTFACCFGDESESRHGLTSMGANGCQLVTACCEEQEVVLCMRDFSYSSRPVSLDESSSTSKFW